MNEFVAVFQVASLTAAIARYLGLVGKSVDRRVAAIATSELNAGLRALDQAQNSQAEARALLREARARFNKAVELEEGYRLVLAHYSLALCHHLLDDRQNAQNELTLVSGFSVSMLFPSYFRVQMAALAARFLPPFVDLAVLVSQQRKLSHMTDEWAKAEPLREAAESILATYDVEHRR